MMKKSKIRVFLADDHHVVRQALSDHLRQDPLIEIVGEVGDGSELLEAVTRHRPDVLLMDLKMPHHNPLEAVPRIREACPEVKLVVLSMHKEAEYVIGLFKAGVDGYILKDDPAVVPSEALHRVMAGERWISPQASAVLAEQLRSSANQNKQPLTGRELEVLSLIARGQRNDEIAAQLNISEHTVRNHISSIFSRLGVETRVEAVVYGLTMGLLSLDRVAKEFKERLGSE